MGNNKSSPSSEKKSSFLVTQILIPIVALVMGGGGVASIYEAKLEQEKARQDKIFQLSEFIIENPSLVCENKSIHNKLKNAALWAAIKNDQNLLEALFNMDSCNSVELKKTIKNSSPTHSKKIIQIIEPEITSNPNIILSRSNTSYEATSNFLFTSINKTVFILSKNKIKDLRVDWDDGKGIQEVKLKSMPNKDYFFTDYFYGPDKLEYRNIRVYEREKLIDTIKIHIDYL